MDSNVELLSKVPVFAKLPSEELQQLSKTLRMHQFSSEEIIFHEGDQGDAFYIVREGQIEIIKAMKTEEEQILGLRGPGEFIGEMSLLIPKGKRIASARATTQANLWEMTRDDFNGLLQRHPMMAYEMVQVLSERLNEAHNQAIEDLHEKNRELSNTLEELTAAQEQIIEKEIIERQSVEVQRQKDLLGGLLKHSPLPIVINNLEHKISIANPAFETLFGYTQAEALGRDLDDILSTPETIEEMRELTEATLGKRVNAVGKRKKKDGSVVDVEMYSTPFYFRGEQYGYMVFYNDISARLKAEAKLEQSQRTTISIVESLEDAYFEADPNGIFTDVNQGFLNALGYDSKDDVIGKHFRHIVDRKSVKEIYTQFQILYKTKKSSKPFETTYRRKDGRTMFGSLGSSPIMEGDDVVGSRGVIRDITPMVEAENALRQARDHAEAHAEELAAINRVAATVSYSLDLEKILRSACVEITKIFNAKNVRIGLLDPPRTTLEIAAFHSTDVSEVDPTGMRLPFDENISLQEVISTKKPIVIPNSQSLLQTAASHEPNNPDNSTALLIVPLVTRGRVIGTIWMLAKDTGHEFTENDIDLSEIIASQMASAVDNARLYSQTEKALDVVERDLEIGRQIQSSFFPETVPKIQGYELVPYFQPARQVAGDFYDIFRIGDSNYIGIVIADVCDKGVGAALFMVLFRSLVRSFSEQFQQIEKTDISLPNIVAKINNYVALTHGHSNMFATMFYGILDPTTNTLTYVNGGNEPPVVIDSQGRIKSQLEPTGPAVGLMPDMDFNIGHLVFEPGDLLIAYTDGIPEAKNVNGDFYSEDRLLNQVSQPWSSAFSAVKQLEADLFDHIGDLPQFDDVTLVAVQREVEGQPKLHKIALEANLPNLPRMREFVVEACEQLGVNENVCFSVKLAVDEACTNLVHHGYKDMDPGDIRLRVERQGEKLQVQIEDTGCPFDPELAREPDLESNLDDREPGGLGVYFMKEMVDEISYESKDGVNRLTIGMNL